MRSLTLATVLTASCMWMACDSGSLENDNMGDPSGFAIEQEPTDEPTDEPADSPSTTDPGTQPNTGQPGDTTPPPAEPPVENTGLSCKDIYGEIEGCYNAYYNCAAACQDQGCADSCEEVYWGCFDEKVALGSTQGQTLFNSVRACEDQNYQTCYDKGGVVYNACAEKCSDDACTKTCAEEANDTLKGCMAEACTNEFEQCGLTVEAPPADDTPQTPQNPADPQESGLTCKGIYESVTACYGTYSDCASNCQDQACADTCEETYWGCFDGKVADGSDQAQVDFKALRACEEEHYQGCYDKGGELYESCAATCTDDDCTQDCGEQASAILKDCMVTACQAEFDTCAVFDENAPTQNGNGNDNGADPNNPGGDLGCSELYTCEDACKGNQDCGQSCYDSGSQAAQSQWTSLIQCGQQFCDGQVADAEGYKQCLQAMCSQEYGSCFSGNNGGGNNPPDGGNGGGAQATCGDSLTCVKDCYQASNSEQSFYACVDVCYANMNDQATQLMDSLASCTDAQCYNVPGSIDNYFKCQQDFCPNQYNACMSQN
jgi:hypothetical protein